MFEMVRDRLRIAWGWLLRRQPKLDHARDYWDVLVKQWNEHLFETTSPIGVAFLVWWITGSPPVNLVLCVVVWVFLLAGYYAWREEHLKTLTDDFKGEIYGATTVHPDPASPDRSAKAFIGVRIVNVGPPSSIPPWQVSMRKPGQPGVHLADGMLFEGEIGNLPSLIRGRNLHGDTRLFATGETPEGWIAFNIGDASDHEILTSVSLGFTDVFDKFHEVPSLLHWVKKTEMTVAPARRGSGL